MALDTPCFTLYWHKTLGILDIITIYICTKFIKQLGHIGLTNFSVFILQVPTEDKCGVGISPPGSKDTQTCVPARWVLKLSGGCLVEKQTLLTTEPSPDLVFLCFLTRL